MQKNDEDKRMWIIEVIQEFVLAIYQHTIYNRF